MKDQNDIDTAPVLMKENTQVTFESIELPPGDRAELVLSPERALRCPILFLSSTNKDSTIVIEQIVHGRTAIFDRENITLEQLRFGKATGLTVTESEPIKIIVINTSPFKTTVGASLVTNESVQDTTYRLSGNQIAQDDTKEK